MRKSDSRTIGGLMILKIIGAVLALLYSVYQVRYFGASRLIEIYFAAHAIVYLFISLTQSGQLAEIYLPEYLRIKQQEGPYEASRSFSVVINRLVVYIIGLLILMYIVAPFLIRLFVPGFSMADKELGTVLFRSMSPLVVLIVLNAFFNSVLNAEKVYGRSEASAVLNACISLCLLIGFFEKLGVWVLVLSLYSGILLQMLISIYFLYKKKIRYHFIWESTSIDNSFFRTLYSTLGYSTSVHFYNWAMTSSLSFLPEGIYAIFNYVQKLYSKTTAILIQPFSTVYFTDFASNVDDKKRKEVSLLYTKAVMWGLWIAIFSFVYIRFYGESIISFLWEGRNFGESDIALAFKLLVLYFIIFLVQNYSTISRKLVIAFGYAKSTYNWSTSAMIFSAIISYLAIHNFGFAGLLVSVLISKILLLGVPILIKKVNFHTVKLQKEKSFSGLPIILFMLYFFAHMTTPLIYNAFMNPFSKFAAGFLILGFSYLLMSIGFISFIRSKVMRLLLGI